MVQNRTNERSRPRGLRRMQKDNALLSLEITYHSKAFMVASMDVQAEEDHGF